MTDSEERTVASVAGLFNRLEAMASAACSFRLLAAYPVNPVKKLFIFSAQPLTGLEME